MIQRLSWTALCLAAGAVLAYGYIQGLLWEFLTVSTYMPQDPEELQRVVNAERTQFLKAGTVISVAFVLSMLPNIFFLARKIGRSEVGRGGIDG